MERSACYLDLQTIAIALKFWVLFHGLLTGSVKASKL